MVNGTSHPEPDGQLSLRARSDALKPAEQQILGQLERLGFDESARFAVRLATEEALANALVHGNNEDPGGTIHVRWWVEPNAITIEIQDEGDGFDPGSVPDPTAEENIELPSGRGIMLMRSFMSEVRFLPPGNCVRMTYRTDAPGPAAYRARDS